RCVKNVMKIPPVKGTRDFYPPIMALRNALTDGWKAASVRNGFEEYDGPILEMLKMYQVKSGDEIVDQLFSLRDRGGRDLAIRPEITPTLARMVNQQINALPRPVKWFSVPRLCRAERPQKGRLREFFQWNIDIIGIESVLADAEIVFCAVDYLKSVGLTAKDIVVRISSRRMLAEVLKAIGIPEDQLDPLYALLDKINKLPPEAFAEKLAELVPAAGQQGKIQALMKVASIEDVAQVTPLTDAAQSAVDELNDLFATLGTMGIADFCMFDISIVRGLAYYTGVVFEIYDREQSLRAIGGGGRYDNLLKQFGGPQVTATGLGMGDCVLAILLEEKGLLKDLATRSLDYFVACADAQYQSKAIEITAILRSAGKITNGSYKTGALGKQFKQASEQNAAQTIIVGSEVEDGQLAVKDMATGEQTRVDWAEFVGQL
ncbi:MAG: histidine--tRNA ligase, partial [Planctomycetes bacterium]|nr:histidine--tRNA ligase [Planctomycetota bacterium]